MILLDPDGIVRELIQGYVFCTLEQAASAVKIQGEKLYLCEQVAQEYGISESRFLKIMKVVPTDD